MQKSMHDPDILNFDAEGFLQTSRLEKHHINLRRVGVTIAVIASFIAVSLEVYVLSKLESWKELGHIVVFLAIAPITSFTIIVVFILIGSFRKSEYRNDNFSPNWTRQIEQHLTSEPG